MVSQFRSPIIITSIFSESHFLRKVSYSLKRLTSEFGGLYHVTIRNDLLCGFVISMHDSCFVISVQLMGIVHRSLRS